MTEQGKIYRLFFVAVAGMAVLIVGLTMVRFQTVHGNEYGIKETFSEGVLTNVLGPQTYWLFPAFTKKIYLYDGSSQLFVMNDKPMSEEKAAAGREKDSYLVQSKEGQDMRIALNLRWRIDSTKLVQIHKTVRHDIEEKIIRPVVMRVVKDEATQMTAIDAYAGPGLVSLQKKIQDALAGSDATEGKELRERGIIVENFVIEHIGLDPNYIAEIVKKQIAVQSQLRAVEEQRAADADALVARSKAMADYNTKMVNQQLLATNQVIQAQADNQKVVIAAEAAAQQVEINAKAQAQQVTIAAEAQKEQMRLSGEGQKLQQEAQADGILAQGRAEAKAKELMLQAYMSAGTNAFVQVEVAKALAAGFQNIQGYLPENIHISTLSQNFLDAMSSIFNRPPGTPGPPGTPVNALPAR